MLEESVIRALLIMEDDLTRVAIQQGLASIDVQVVSSVSSPTDLRNRSLSDYPNLIVTDVVFNAKWSEGLIESLRTTFSSAKVVVVASSGDVRVFIRSVIEGARGFFRRDVDLATLILGLRSVCDSELLVVGPLVLEEVKNHLPHILNLVPSPEVTGIPEEELALLPSLVAGDTISDIANRRRVSRRTIDRRIKSLYSRLGARSSFEAGAVSAKRGLI